MKRYYLLLLILLCGQLSFAEDSVEGSKPVRIAVMDLKGVGISDDALENMTERLRHYLTQTNKYNVFERSEMSSILKEHELALSGCTDGDDCAIEIGRFLSVPMIVAGKVTKLKTEEEVLYSTYIRLINVNTSKVEKSSMGRDCSTLSELLQVSIKVAAFELADVPLEEKKAEVEKKSRSDKKAEKKRAEEAEAERKHAEKVAAKQKAKEVEEAEEKANADKKAAKAAEKRRAEEAEAENKRLAKEQKRAKALEEQKRKEAEEKEDREKQAQREAEQQAQAAKIKEIKAQLKAEKERAESLEEPKGIKKIVTNIKEKKAEKKTKKDKENTETSSEQ